ncbi:MAG: hypothetical protein MUO26_01220 [Methanotrichaceae archaeon]|nr:hypothetical protein [Methanotrichaceae archaeon]
MLLYSFGLDPFLEDLTKLADRVFYFEEGPQDPTRLTAKTWQKMKDQSRSEGVLMIRLDVLRGQPCDHVLHLSEILPHTQLNRSPSYIECEIVSYHP